MKKILPPLLMLITTGIFCSCASYIDPEGNELQLSGKWLNTVPKARPVSAEGKLVYLSVRNTSLKNIEFSETVKKEVIKIGYKITDDLDQASYVLMINLRYYGSKSETGYHNTAGGMVVAAGGSEALGHGTDLITILIGGLVGKIADNYDKMVTKDIVIDIRLGEKIGKEFETKVSHNNSNQLNETSKNTNSHSNTNRSLGLGGGIGIKTGKDESNAEDKHNGQTGYKTEESSNFTRSEMFFYHEARLLVSVEKRELEDQEAIKALIPELSRSVSQVLP
ncbi:complement resistance protein TraT [Lentisphaera profundi]|uniref:Complement resistance protein TraT n=1 Tax=Lentisphaera profundi TaxID=1658616 RepID=A0ABY7VZP4_9BACT|nr:complement resistance protein TraT [Lentisphaera profundi]WDE99274.1 complement resistance protein TraT [Lentisphaera profundi]